MIFIRVSLRKLGMQPAILLTPSNPVHPQIFKELFPSQQLDNITIFMRDIIPSCSLISCRQLLYNLMVIEQYFS
ncbi:hypothetical protein LX73_2154 [Fodinibius salinus]|uniref:Uncharacterized protein n=1 Tax=Fodinibius salinus TaxID=860790 RepID=A0A5D3YLL5_9BACT|nr:hypothetical protein LX73_2154 [Fodinibius salinus]